MNLIVEISNQFIDGLKKLAILNKEILSKESGLLNAYDAHFLSEGPKPFRQMNDNPLIPETKGPTAERTNQIIKRRQSMLDDNSDRPVNWKAQKNMR